MTTDKGFKRVVRTRVAATGESYQAARRSLLTRSQEEHVNTPDEYDAAAISLPDSLDTIRAHPTRYLTDTGTTGVTHLALELVANALDEVVSGFASTVSVKVLADGGCRVVDDGRGIPTGPSIDQPGLDALVVAFTVAHAGAKRGAGHYRLPGGRNGLGLKVVTALSSRVEVLVNRNGESDRAVFATAGDSEGRPHPGQLETAVSSAMASGEARTGTSVTFWPDAQVFGTARVDTERLADRLAELACLHPNVTIRLLDEADGATPPREFHEPTGLAAFLSGSRRVDARIGVHESPAGRAEVMIASHTAGGGGAVRAFVNDHPTPAGGPHVDAVIDALTSAGLPLSADASSHPGAVMSLRLAEANFILNDGRCSIDNDQAGPLAAAAAQQAIHS